MMSKTFKHSLVDVIIEIKPKMYHELVQTAPDISFLSDSFNYRLDKEKGIFFFSFNINYTDNEPQHSDTFVLIQEFHLAISFFFF